MKAFPFLGSVCNPPDGAAGVLRDEQCAVMCYGDANGPSPHIGIIDHKPGDEILVFAGGYAVLEANADHLVTGAFGPVP